MLANATGLEHTNQLVFPQSVIAQLGHLNVNSSVRLMVVMSRGTKNMLISKIFLLQQQPTTYLAPGYPNTYPAIIPHMPVMDDAQHGPEDYATSAYPPQAPPPSQPPK